MTRLRRGRRVPLGGIRPRPVSRGRTRHSLGAAPPGAAYAARYGENDAALKTRLETVRTAAEALTSGQELGLVRDRRLLTAGWESGEVDTLFAAIAAGAAIA